MPHVTGMCGLTYGWSAATCKDWYSGDIPGIPLQTAHTPHVICVLTYGWSAATPRQAS
jgi:hypothetical protein